MQNIFFKFANMLSKRTKYGLRAMVHLAREGRKTKLMSVEHLAHWLNVPKHFLANIMRELARHKLVSSQKGPGGGFYLNELQILKSPHDIIMALEGDHFLGSCLLELKPCVVLEPCPFHEHYGSFKESFLAQMASKRLLDLI